MYVVEPVGKTLPYGANRGPLGTPFIYLPQWTGKTLAPAVPDERGNFDHYQPSMPGFEAAHVFGSVRFTLDVWEGYLGQTVAWHFRDHYDRLEISILPDMEQCAVRLRLPRSGQPVRDVGRILPFSLDFDVIAHEVGHAIIFSVLGVPGVGKEFPEYVGFQEAFSDCVSLIAAMHFPSVIDNVLDETRGNLYLANRLSRFSEFSPHRQIRSANNQRTMAEFVHGWKNEHALSQPLTGAIFDILVDIFHESLVARGLISPEVEDLADIAEADPAAEAPLQEAFDRAFARNTEGFCEALLDARDVVGMYPGGNAVGPRARFSGLWRCARAMLAVDRVETGGDSRGSSSAISTSGDRRVARWHADQ